jgi:diguanylate cyclase (GGDEF)-like protein
MGTRFALMFLDLDRFKPVNDHWGHAIGDQLLQEAAQRMTSALRASDTVGRIGGDEFVMLVLDVGSHEDVVAVAEKIRCALRAPYSIEGREISISATIGIAIYPDHGKEITELVGHADMAMYRAKEKGRDRVILFDAGWANAMLAGQAAGPGR